MKNKEIEPLKLKIQFELAYEIIFISTVIILTGLAYLFASNLLRFNWYSVIFGLVALFILILRANSYLIIEDDALKLKIFYFITYKEYEMNTIDKFVFLDQSRKIKITVKQTKESIIYLTEKNRYKLLNWLVKNYPDISCLYL